MSCRKIRRSPSRYYRGELSTEEENLITRHIQVCEECEREARRYKGLNQAVQGLEIFSPSSDFEAKLEQKIREIPVVERKPRSKGLVTTFPSLRWLRWGVVPAIVTALALFFLIKGQSYKPTPSSPQEETDLVKKDIPLLENQKTVLPTTESLPPVNKLRGTLANYPGQRKGNQREVFVIDNLRFSDLERLPDSKLLERRFTNFVMDAVGSRSVDTRQISEGYILPAVSTSRTKVKISY